MTDRLAPSRPQPRPDGAAIPVDLAVVLGAFVISRVLAYRAGMRLETDILGWAWQLLDLQLLRDELGRSLIYLHAQPPVGNALVGLALALEPVSLATSLSVFNHALGLMTAGALLVSFRRLGVSSTLRTVLVTLYTVSPSALLYEHFVAPEYLVAACLAGAMALLLGFARDGRWRQIAGSVALLTTVALTRSLFHLAWLLGASLLIVLCSSGLERRQALLVAVAALAVVGGWYAKNAVLFGSFSGSSWLGMNAARLTTAPLAAADRSALIADGTLSSLARIAPFSSLDAYRGEVRFPPPRGIAAVDAERKANGHPNFNHAAYVAISRAYARDASAVVRHRPRTYFESVRTALAIHLLPSADYVFLEANRARISRYRAVFDGIVGGGFLLGHLPDSRVEPWPPSLGGALRRAPLLALGLPVLLVAGAWMGMATGRDPLARARRLALALACWNVLWVAAIGSLLEVGENNRFRVAVHPDWLLLAGLTLDRLWRSRPSPRYAPGPASPLGL